MSSERRNACIGAQSKGLQPSRRLSSRSERRRRAQPRVETLEDRTLLSASYVLHEVLVQFEADATADQRTAVRAVLGVSLAEEIHTAPMQASGIGVLERLTLPDGLAVDAAISLFQNQPGVVYAEPNWIFSTSVVPNDTHYLNGNHWGMYSDDSPSIVGPPGTTNQYGSQAEEAWFDDKVGSDSVFVGIIDEGYQFTHPDLDGNAWLNPFDPVDGIDNDGNGYIDDTRGWDFDGNDNTIYDGPGDDHGTHVAGTIGAEGNNGLGVAGVNWNVTLIGAKFLGAGGGTTANAIKAVDYITDLKNRHGLNIVATNNSWGGGGYSAGLHSAIIRAAKSGILFIAAAGNSNSNNDASASYPSNYNTTISTPTETAASYDGVIAVASITSTGAKSGFSSYGATTVDLGAPGSSIISTVPTDAYAFYDGTSMATPHVTGAAALYAATYPGLTAAQIKDAILTSARPTTSLAGITLTGGRLDIRALLDISPEITVDIDDETVTEGDFSNTIMTFTVNISEDHADTVTMSYYTVEGSATSGVDFEPVSGTLTFGPGVRERTIDVTIYADLDEEKNETFVVKLHNLVGNNIKFADDDGVGTIGNDDITPQISINDRGVSEGDSGEKDLTFDVTLHVAGKQTVTVYYETVDGSAKAGSDYVATSGMLTFTAGDMSEPITVRIKGDTAPEGNESFFVNLFDADKAVIVDAVGVGTILEDDLPAASINDASVVEGHFGTKLMTFALTLSKPSDSLVTVYYRTFNGTALAGSDYVFTSGFATFNPSQTSKNVTVSVMGDLLVEPNETFLVRLTSALNATLGDFEGTGTIMNDDSSGGKSGGRLTAAFLGRGASSLQRSQIQPVLNEAVRRLSGLGLDVAGLSKIQVGIRDLPGATLGKLAGSTIWIDANAAGHGWFVDPTPGDRSEFTTPGDQGEAGRMDLLTVLTHELGHKLGLAHDAGGFMAEVLSPGQRPSAPGAGRIPPRSY